MDFSELPNGWTKTTIGNLVVINYGKSLPAKNRDNEGFNVYGSNGPVGKHSVPSVTHECLILGRKGSIGEVHHSVDPCSPIDTTYYVDEFNGQSVIYWKNLFKYLPLKELNRATALPGLNRDDVYNLWVLLPPLNEQRRIADKIDALQSKSRTAREALEKVQPLLEKFRQSVLAAAFRGDLTAEWRQQNSDVEPASKLLERIRAERRQRWEEAELAKMEAKGKNPKNDKWKARYKDPEYSNDTDAQYVTSFANVEALGWADSPLLGLCDDQRGIPYGIVQTGKNIVGGVPTVRCGDIKGFFVNVGELKLVDSKISSAYERTVLVGGEVLIAIRGSVGETAIVSDEMVGINISREVAMIPVLSGVLPKFIMYLLASPVGQGLLMDKVKGVAQQGINLADLRQFPVPLPCVDEQREIVFLLDDIMKRINGICDFVSQSKGNLEKTDQSILAKAFRGELVPQDPDDEPASVLLERIKAEREAQKAKGKKKVVRRKKVAK